MSFIFIETCTEKSLLFFYKDGHICFEKAFPPGLNNSRHIYPAIAEGLTASNQRLSELNFIAVGIGPGSYTGIRIGAMTAKTLSYALKLPLVGISTLQCFKPQEEGSFAVIIDAKIGGAYIITGEKNKDKVSYTCKPALVELDQLGALIASVQCLITPNEKALKPKLEALYPFNGWQWQVSPPSSCHMAHIAFENFKAGKVCGHETLELLYLRKTQAEREREALGQMLP